MQPVDSKQQTNMALNTLGSAINDYVALMKETGHGTASQVLGNACQTSSQTIQNELNRLYKVEQAHTDMMKEQLAMKEQQKEPIEGEVDGKKKAGGSPSRQ